MGLKAVREKLYPTGISPSDLEVRLGEHGRPWRWEELFGRPCPVEVEIGTGNGTFLVDAALKCPGHGFLGIEVSEKFFIKALKRGARLGAANVRMVCADATYILRHYIPPASVLAFHVYFPEPWPKKRHAKRRLFQPHVVELLARGLKAGGYILLATDARPYFEAIQEMMAQEERLERLEEPHVELVSVQARCPTSYETKYRAEGRPIYLAAWQRKPFSREEEALEPPRSAPALKEEPMPHVVVEQALPLKDYVAGFRPIVFKEGATVCKATEAYLSQSEGSALIEALVVEEGRSQKFFVLVTARSGRATVQLLRLTDPDKTPGVKRLIGLVAKDLKERSPGASFGPTNIEPFLR